FCLTASIGLEVVISIIFFALGNIAGGVIFLIIALFNGLWVYLIRDRVPFSAALLSTVAQIIQLFPAVLPVAYVAVGMQVTQALAAQRTLKSPMMTHLTLVVESSLRP